MLIRATIREGSAARPEDARTYLLIGGARMPLRTEQAGEQYRAAVIEETADDDGSHRGRYPACPDCGARRRGGRIPGWVLCWWCGSQWIDTRHAPDWRREALAAHPWWPRLTPDQQAAMMAGDLEWDGAGEAGRRIRPRRRREEQQFPGTPDSTPSNDERSTA